MYFWRKGAGGDEHLDPREQALSVPDSSTVIYPSRIHASTAHQPLIKLVGTAKQLVELDYALPKGGNEYQYVVLNWKIHYKKDGQNLVLAEAERFDYVETSKIDKGVGQYGGSLDFPASARHQILKLGFLTAGCGGDRIAPTCEGFLLKRRMVTRRRPRSPNQMTLSQRPSNVGGVQSMTGVEILPSVDHQIPQMSD